MLFELCFEQSKSCLRTPLACFKGKVAAAALRRVFHASMPGAPGNNLATHGDLPGTSPDSRCRTRIRAMRQASFNYCHLRKRVALLTLKAATRIDKTSVTQVLRSAEPESLELTSDF
jgi:hypothetical protein